MKSMIRIFAVTVILSFSLNVFTLQAKERKHQRKHHNGMHKLSDEQKQELLEIKNYLDSKLSKEDLSKLNDLRELVKEEKSEMIQEIKAKKQKGANKSELREYIKSLREEMRDDKEELKEALKELAENNSELMKEVGEKLKHLLPENGKLKNHDNKKHFARFLLWDGNFPDKRDFEGLDVDNRNNLEVKYNGNSLSVETEENISGIAYIYDAQGSQIAELGTINLNEGNNTISLNEISSKLNNGAYFFIIESIKGTKRGKFIYLK